MRLKSEIEKSGADNSLQWYVIYTHPKQEDRADKNLRAWQIETFFPRIKERRFSLYGAKRSFVTKPFFPRYIFARFRVGELFQKICFTRGVNSVVSFGDGPPIPVDNEMITLIQSQRDEDGLIRLSENIKPGDKVVINYGPFKDLIGIFEQETAVTRRVSVLLAMVCYQGRLIVEKDFVRKLDERL
jgi:transcriptional antiterminator RfaH